MLIRPVNAAQYPTCSRCKKRRDACSYGEGVFVCASFPYLRHSASSLTSYKDRSEEVVEGSDQQRIAELESKICRSRFLLNVIRS